METAVTAPAPITDQNVYPLEVPNQPADPAGMNGCTPDGWRDQSAGLNVARWARGYLQFTVAADADPMILAAGVGVFTLFSKGIGESSSDANGLVYGENLDDTDTLAVMAIQRADGDASTAEASRLQALVQALGEAPHPG